MTIRSGVSAVKGDPKLSVFIINSVVIANKLFIEKKTQARYVIVINQMYY